MEKFYTPVLLLTGYLGSGKTTLLNHILTNAQGIRFAVIVNDIGEVNIDANLIEKGGIVGAKDQSLVALQNGCICCTLQMDLVSQLHDIITMQKFHYIVIEASGICEPAPIASTICNMPRLVPQFAKDGLARLDNIVTVVDALRLKSEFGCGNALTSKELEEEDIENLIIQQIEFCNMILLNKASEVTPEELKEIKSIIRALQPKAEIIECDWCKVDLSRLLNTGLFNFEAVSRSAAWVEGVERACCLYLHDKGKILAFLCGTADKRAVTEALRETLPAGMPAPQKLVTLTHELFTMIDNSVSIELLARLLSAQLVTHGEKHLLDRSRTYFKLLNQVIRCGQERGELRDDMTVNEIVKAYAMFERALMYDWCLSGGEYALSKYADQMIPIFLAGFKK